MGKLSRVLLVIAILFYVIAFFIPSILTENSLPAILEFTLDYPIAYQSIFIILFPIIVVLTFFRRYKVAFYLSFVLIYVNNNLFEDIIALIFGYLHTGSNIWFIPVLVGLIIIGWVLIRVALKNRTIWLYGVFIFFVVLFYYFTIEVNCRFQYNADMAFSTNNISVWFENCGTYYAWWTSGILLNIALFLKLFRIPEQQL